jgi:hypothetical protein
MNGFLVLVKCLDEDVPLGLFATAAEAEAWAGTLTERDIDDIAGRVSTIQYPEIICIVLMEFRGGVPEPQTGIVDVEDIPSGYDEDGEGAATAEPAAGPVG